MRPNMAEIVRHLVDEERCACAVDAGVGDEILPEFGQLIGGQIVQHLRIEVLPPHPPPAQPVRQRKNIGQFERAIDHANGLARDLFEAASIRRAAGRG